jgi:hypothetical protein
MLPHADPGALAKTNKMPFHILDDLLVVSNPAFRSKSFRVSTKAVLVEVSYVRVGHRLIIPWEILSTRQSDSAAWYDPGLSKADRRRVMLRLLDVGDPVFELDSVSVTYWAGKRACCKSGADFFDKFFVHSAVVDDEVEEMRQCNTGRI